MRKQNRHRKPVRHSIESAERMANCMNITHTSSCKCASRMKCSLLHILSRLQICPVFICCQKTFMNQSYCLTTHQTLKITVICIIRVCFHCMTQRIHSCLCCYLWWQSYCKARIKYCKAWHQLQIIDWCFMMCLNLGNHRCNRCLRPAAWSCRHGEDYRNRT